MISLVITEDQLMLRKAMVQLIEMHEEMNVLKDFENGLEILEFIENNEPNVAILDIEIPGITGLEILSYVRKKQLNTRIIIVTTFKRPGYFEKAVANDVDAYVLKERSIDDLIKTIYKVTKGEKEYSPSLMTSLFTVVLREIGNGLSSKEIASKLYLSNGTVRNYTSTIIDKMNSDHRFEAWKKANEKGWI